MTIDYRKFLLAVLLCLPLGGVVLLVALWVRDPSVTSKLQLGFVALFLGMGAIWIGRVLVGIITKTRSPASLCWRFVFGVLLAGLGLLFLRHAPGSPDYNPAPPVLLFAAAMVAAYLANRADRGGAGSSKA